MLSLNGKGSFYGLHSETAAGGPGTALGLALLGSAVGER